MSVDVRGSDRCEFYYYAAKAAIQLYANYAKGFHFSAFHYMCKHNYRDRTTMRQRESQLDRYICDTDRRGGNGPLCT